MKTTFATESHTSPAPGIIPEPPLVHDEPAAPIPRPGRGQAGSVRPATRRSPLARVLAALRGDKYMVDAYPPPKPPTGEG